MPTKGASIGEIRKKVTKTYEQISTSYHEAGHAVFALLHLMKVTSVYIFEHKKYKRIHGYTYNTIPLITSIEDPQVYYKLLENEVAFGYAGLIAEKHLFRLISGSNQIPLFIKNGSSDDIGAATKLITQYNLVPPGQKRYAFKRKVNRKVLRVLKEHWGAVSLIAYELFSHKRLSHQDLYDLLTTKSNNKKFWKRQFETISQIYDNGPIDENLLRIRLLS